MSLLHRAACILALALISTHAAAAEPAQVTIDAVKAASTPKLDGVLDDECWKDLPEYSGFGDNLTRKLQAKQTVVKICYDANYVYIAFHALHPDPTKIRAEETKRNGTSYWKDDFVCVYIDSRHTHRNSSYFAVTARGTQIENIERSSSQNIQYKGDWLSAVKVVGDGYIAEMAIPFSLLVYNNNQDTIGITFGRQHNDEQSYSVWPDLNGTGDGRFYAHWQGLELPKSKPRPQILSYVLGQSGSDSERSNYQGMDIKYAFTPNSLGVLSINPDFNTIEQQVESIDFSYTERYLDDARPFFNEWEIPVDERVFYSRRIEDFESGIKFAANSGANSYGLMTMRTYGEQSDTVASFTRNIGQKSGVMVNMSEHNTPGHKNRVTYYRGRAAFTRGQRTHKFTGGYFDSSTTGQPGGQSDFVAYSTVAGDGDIGAYFDYGRTDETFNGEIGYSSDIGIEGSTWGLWREKSFRNKYVQYLQIAYDAQDLQYIDGRPYNKNQSGYIRMDYADGHNIRFGYMWQQHEQFTEKMPFASVKWNRYSLNRDGGAGISWGSRAGGTYLQHWLEQKFRIGEKIALGVHWQRDYIGDPSPYAGTNRQTIVTVNYDLTDERSLGGRIVAQQGESNVFFMYRQQVRHGTDAYLIYGDPNALTTDNRLSLKLIRAM